MVRLSRLSFRFDSKFRLSVDELTIREGEILSIIGPNGAGKTTLLNIIALHESPESGSVELFGREVRPGNDSVKLRRQMSYVFSQPQLLRGSVYDNVSLPLKLQGRRDPERVRRMLDLFEIAALKDTCSSRLSQGQRHRVALARAFSNNPKLVLLDEPFASLEERYKETLICSLRDAIRETRSAVVFTTHDHDEALALADTVAVMRQGKILQTGTPEDIFTRPVSKEVAVFVGIRTILEGKIIDKVNNLCSVAVGSRIINAVSEREKGDDVFVCIRPEDVVLSHHRESISGRNDFKAVISGIEPWGLAYKLILDCGFPLVALAIKQSVRDMDLSIGHEAFISVKATAIHLILNDTVAADPS